MSLEWYQRLLQDADLHFSEIRAQNRGSFQCRRGCHSCCEPGLTVLKIEAYNIVEFLLENPTVAERAKKLEEDDPYKGSRCSFLDEEGECLIYSVRPFVCRSHGAPIAIEREDYYQIDVCPLNFQHNPIERLGPESFFILSEWNERLLDASPDEERLELRVSSLLSL
ncbi:MAG: YkgJ family cysteine cluster protein [Myxococcota bacterium]|nr:YkgJ family cysteine cluster protein [Myxococcota bacterium]